MVWRANSSVEVPGLQLMSLHSQYKFNRLLAMTSLLMAVPGAFPAEAREKVLHRFSYYSDGAFPSGLISDRKGNLYGTTYSGGGNNCGITIGECGTIFEIAKDGTETILHAFNGADGAEPSGPLLRDSSGNFYGATAAGGGSCQDDEFGCGTVFKLTRHGEETLVYTFKGGSDGWTPGNLIADASGNLYGVTANGGNPNSACRGYGCGTVFELQPNGNKIALYRFQGGNDGWWPASGMIFDGAGNLYGATFYGGGSTACQYGCGTVFKIAPNGTETVLHDFQGGRDGAVPEAGVITDEAGNLYGITAAGGGTCSTWGASGCGTVFRLAPEGTETILYAFQGGADGSTPIAGVISDLAGNLYGTTSYGGSTSYYCGVGCGTVFKLAPDGTKTVLITFRPKMGEFPGTALLAGRGGALYGTALRGGEGKNSQGYGVVYKLTP